MTCYVCGREIIPRLVKERQYDAQHMLGMAAMYQGRLVRRADIPLYVGRDTYRHQSCEAGSKAWMKYQKAMRKKSRSEFYKIFLEIQKKSLDNKRRK
jgi:hypothetical protein